MASIIGKKRGEATYYYLAESARVGGKPRIVSQEYLGTAEELAAAMRGGGLGLPGRVQRKDFGAAAAAWGLLEDLGVAAIIDEVTGARRSDAGASAGTYLVLAALNRVVAPCSKLAFADWWARTAGPRFTRIPATVLDHRRFWDAMRAVSLEDLEEISRRIAVAITGTFGLDCSSVALDMTNFATFIATGNAKAPVAQRGKAKQKRADLRLVGLGLVVTRDGGIPLTWHAYPGDRPDVTQFATMISQLRAPAEPARWPAGDGGQGSGGRGGGCLTGFGFGDAAEGDLEAECFELADVVANRAAVQAARASGNRCLRRSAEADGNRTRRRRGAPPAGFEDRGAHQVPRRLRTRPYPHRTGLG